MKVIKATQQMLETRTLVLGFQGENLRTQLRIDCAATFAEYPNATPALAVKPSSGETYPVFVERDGNEVVWDIVANNLVLKGDGELQLTFYKDNVIAKTYVGHIRVNRSLQIDGEMPDVVATWIENANRKLAEVDAQIVELEGMVDTATDAATSAEQSASTSSTKAEQAAGSAATATAKANEATTAAGTATAKAAEAQTAAGTAAESERIATAKAGDATTAAGTATAKAGQATEAAQTATEKAGDASASATAAQASASNAASSATAAQAAQTAARASETAAGASATQAAQSAQTANTAAQTATQKAGEAAISASNAATSATNAATSAETASTKAGEAAQSAQAVAETAEQLAESLEQIEQNTQDIAEHEQYAEATYAKKTDLYKKADIIHNTASGTIASFPDGAEMPVDEVTAQINPVQDLHGYENPWPAGGGKNLFNSAVFPTVTRSGITCTNNGDGSFTFNGTAEAETYFDLFTWQFSTAKRGTPLPADVYRLTGCPSGGGSNSYFLYTIPDYVTDYGNGTTMTSAKEVRGGSFYIAKGYTCNNVTVRPMIRVATNGDDTFAPYSNICPISGFDGLTVTRTGKNLLNVDDSLKLAFNNAYGNWTSTNGVITITGNATGGYIMPCKPSTKYAYSFGTTYRGEDLNIRVYEFSEYPTALSEGTLILNNITNANRPPNKFTTTENGHWLVVGFYGHHGTGSENNIVLTNMQIEVGETATAYEPYQGETYPITFPSEAGTVYGGSLTIAEDGSGVLTVDRAMRDMGTLNWSYLSPTSNIPYGAFYANVFGKARKENDIVCSAYPLSTNYFRADKSVLGNSASNTVYVIDSSYADTTTFASAMSGVQLVYELATPETYNLTASQITTLLGENNLWHDANGNISVGYKANTKLYIDNKITQAIAAALNS